MAAAVETKEVAATAPTTTMDQEDIVTSAGAAGAMVKKKWPDTFILDKVVHYKCDSCGQCLPITVKEEDCPSCANFRRGVQIRNLCKEPTVPLTSLP